MIAGVRVDRTIQGIEAVVKGGRVEDVKGRVMFRIPEEEYLEAVMMGPYRTETGKEYLRGRKGKGKVTLRGAKTGRGGGQRIRRPSQPLTKRRARQAQ
jgi:hypothetical protein